MQILPLHALSSFEAGVKGGVIAIRGSLLPPSPQKNQESTNELDHRFVRANNYCGLMKKGAQVAWSKLKAIPYTEESPRKKKPGHEGEETPITVMASLDHFFFSSTNPAELSLNSLLQLKPLEVEFVETDGVVFPNYAFDKLWCVVVGEDVKANPPFSSLNEFSNITQTDEFMGRYSKFIPKNLKELLFEQALSHAQNMDEYIRAYILPLKYSAADDEFLKSFLPKTAAEYLELVSTLSQGSQGLEREKMTSIQSFVTLYEPYFLKTQPTSEQRIQWVQTVGKWMDINSYKDLLNSIRKDASDEKYLAQILTSCYPQEADNNFQLKNEFLMQYLSSGGSRLAEKKRWPELLTIQKKVMKEKKVKEQTWLTQAFDAVSLESIPDVLLSIQILEAHIQIHITQEDYSRVEYEAYGGYDPYRGRYVENTRQVKPNSFKSATEAKIRQVLEKKLNLEQLSQIEKWVNLYPFDERLKTKISELKIKQIEKKLKASKTASEYVSAIRDLIKSKILSDSNNTEWDFLLKYISNDYITFLFLQPSHLDFTHLMEVLCEIYPKYDREQSRKDYLFHLKRVFTDALTRSNGQAEITDILRKFRNFPNANLILPHSSEFDFKVVLRSVTKKLKSSPASMTLPQFQEFIAIKWQLNQEKAEKVMVSPDLFTKYKVIQNFSDYVSYVGFLNTFQSQPYSYRRNETVCQFVNQSETELARFKPTLKEIYQLVGYFKDCRFKPSVVQWLGEKTLSLYSEDLSSAQVIEFADAISKLLQLSLDREIVLKNARSKLSELMSGWIYQYLQKKEFSTLGDLTGFISQWFGEEQLQLQLISWFRKSKAPEDFLALLQIKNKGSNKSLFLAVRESLFHFYSLKPTDEQIQQLKAQVSADVSPQVDAFRFLLQKKK